MVAGVGSRTRGAVVAAAEGREVDAGVGEGARAR